MGGFKCLTKQQFILFNFTLATLTAYGNMDATFATEFTAEITMFNTTLAGAWFNH